MRNIALIQSLLFSGLVTQTAVGGGATTTGQNAGSVTVQARPLGQWCGRAATFAVSLTNVGSTRYYVGLPDRSGAGWPYRKWTYGFAFDKGGTGGGAGICGLEGTVDYELCAIPNRAVELAPSKALGWTLELQPQELRDGPAEFHVTLYWFGGGTVGDALKVKSIGEATVPLSIQRTTEGCVITQVRTAG